MIIYCSFEKWHVQSCVGPSWNTLYTRTSVSLHQTYIYYMQQLWPTKLKLRLERNTYAQRCKVTKRDEFYVVVNSQHVQQSLKTALVLHGLFKVLLQSSFWWSSKKFNINLVKTEKLYNLSCFMVTDPRGAPQPVWEHSTADYRDFFFSDLHMLQRSWNCSKMAQ